MTAGRRYEIPPAGVVHRSGLFRVRRRTGRPPRPWGAGPAVGAEPCSAGVPAARAHRAARSSRVLRMPSCPADTRWPPRVRTRARTSCSAGTTALRPLSRCHTCSRRSDHATARTGPASSVSAAASASGIAAPAFDRVRGRVAARRVPQPDGAVEAAGGQQHDAGGVETGHRRHAGTVRLDDARSGPDVVQRPQVHAAPAVGHGHVTRGRRERGGPPGCGAQRGGVVVQSHVPQAHGHMGTGGQRKGVECPRPVEGQQAVVRHSTERHGLPRRSTRRRAADDPAVGEREPGELPQAVRRDEGVVVPGGRRQEREGVRGSVPAVTSTRSKGRTRQAA